MAVLSSLEYKPLTSKVVCFTLSGSTKCVPEVIKELDIRSDVLTVEGCSFTKSTIKDVIEGSTKLEDIISWVLVDLEGRNFRISIHDFNKEITRMRQ